jgi:uncharacterized RDD family membrane protein YckC
MQWYYAVNGQRLGPVTQGEIEQLVRSGTIGSDTLVWSQGMANWQPFSTVASQFPGAAAPVPVAPSAAGLPDDDTAVCAVSGKRYPKREMLQYEGKWISAEHRDAYFQRMREGVSAPGEAVYGGFWIRFGAKFIDGLILAVVFGILYAVLFFVVFAKSFSGGGNPENIGAILAMQGILMLSNMAINLAYNWFFLAKYSATPGKMAVGLKVVRSDGSSLTNGRIIGRFFAEMLSGMILYIGYIIAGFDEEKRALHDHICDTRVIKSR